MPVPQDSTEWQSCLMVGQVRHRRTPVEHALNYPLLCLVLI